MSKRLLVTIILVLGLVSVVFFFQRRDSTKGASSSAPLPSAPSTTPSAASSSPTNVLQDRAVSSSENAASGFDSPASLSSMEGRTVRSGNRQIRNGLKSFSSEGARWRDDLILQGSDWKVWEGVTAYPKAAGRPQIGKSLGEVNGFYLVDEGFVADTVKFDGKPIVVIDPQNNRAGVLTGVYGVTLEEGADATFLTQDAEFKVTAAFPDIQTYYVTSSTVPFDLNTMKNKLLNAPEVKSVHFEILSRQYEKQ